MSAAPLDLSGIHPMLRRRPKTRGECAGGFRPCPWVSCRYHLAIDVGPQGRSAPRVFEKSDPDDWTPTTPTCALDLADEGPRNLDSVGVVMGGLTPERIRQIESKAMRRIRGADAAEDLSEYLDNPEAIDTSIDDKPPPKKRETPMPAPPRPDTAQHKAQQRVKEILRERAMTIALLARRVAAYDPKDLNLCTSTYGLISNAKPAATSRYWDMVACALGLSLADIGDDADWVAAQPVFAGRRTHAVTRPQTMLPSRPAPAPAPAPKPESPASRFFDGPLLSDSIPVEDEEVVEVEEVEAKAFAEDSIDDGPVAALDAPAADDDDPQDDTDLTGHITGEPPPALPPPPAPTYAHAHDPARALGLAIIDALDAPRREADAARDAAVAEALERAARAEERAEDLERRLAYMEIVVGGLTSDVATACDVAARLRSALAPPK